MRPLSANIEQDNTPWVLPDGRILYMRWEYIDRSQVNYHHLWTMYPDGTEQSVFFGNLHPGGVFIDARPIPGSRDVIMINSPGHGQTEHAGFVARVSPQQGPDVLGNLVNISKQGDYRDPWAFSGDAFMAAENERLVLMNDRGETATLFTAPKEFGPVWLHEPRPIVAHPVEFAIPPRVDLAKPTGKYLLEDVYRGRNMSGIRPGEIKKLMVIESLPKPINFTGGMDPLSYAGTFTLGAGAGHGAGRGRRLGLFRGPRLAEPVVRGPGRPGPGGQADAEFHDRAARRDRGLRRLPRASHDLAAFRAPAAAACLAAQGQRDRAVSATCPTWPTSPATCSRSSIATACAATTTTGATAA